MLSRKEFMVSVVLTCAVWMLVSLAFDTNSLIRDLKTEISSPAEIRSDGLILLTACDGSRVAMPLHAVVVVANYDGCLNVMTPTPIPATTAPSVFDGLQ